MILASSSVRLNRSQSRVVTRLEEVLTCRELRSASVSSVPSLSGNNVELSEYTGEENIQGMLRDQQEVDDEQERCRRRVRVACQHVLHEHCRVNQPLLLRLNSYGEVAFPKCPLST